jgi:hypothetical protein
VRRGDPERIYQAQRAGFLTRLTRSLRVRPDRAEALIADLERDAPELGLRRGSVEFRREADRRAEYL